MVRELGVDAAEAQPKESEHVAAPKTDAANKIDVKLFMRKSLRFRAWIPCDRRPRSSLRARGAFSRKGEPLSAAPERAPQSDGQGQNISGDRGRSRKQRGSAVAQ